MSSFCNRKRNFAPKYIDFAPYHAMVCGIMGTMHRETFIDLRQERAIRLPFQLAQTGAVISADFMRYEIRDHRHLEFCLRLSSPEPYAIDELDGKRFRHAFPHLFIKRPGVFHRYEIHGERRALFMIYPSESAALFDAAGMRIDSPGIEFTITPRLEALFEQYRALFPISQQYGAAEQFDLLALQILETVFLQHQTVLPPHDETERKLREICSRFQLHFSEPGILDDAVARFGLSRRSFFRHWHETFSTTPAQAVLDLKIQEARRLLAARSLQIQEIADRLGFQCASYFIQVFKRHCGMTPNAYRHAMRTRSGTHSAVPEE